MGGVGGGGGVYALPGVKRVNPMNNKKEEIKPAYFCLHCRKPFTTTHMMESHKQDIIDLLEAIERINAHASPSPNGNGEESGEEISHGYHLTTRPSPPKPFGKGLNQNFDALEGLAWMADGTDRPWLAKHGSRSEPQATTQPSASEGAPSHDPSLTPKPRAEKEGGNIPHTDILLPNKPPSPEPQIVLWRGRKWLAVDYSKATLAELLCVREAVCDADFQTLYVPLS